MDSGVPEGACSHGADDKQTESARMYVFEEESLKASDHLRETLHKSEKLGEELDKVRRASAEMDATICSLGNCIRKMVGENRALKAQD